MASTNRVYTHQYPPLRVPSGWSPLERSFARQLQEILDDIYRRFGRLSTDDVDDEISDAVDSATAVDKLTARGDLLTRSATAYSRLAVGTSGQYLGTDGTDPAWETFAAADIPIADAGTYYATDTVEAALQELATSYPASKVTLTDAGTYFATDTAEAALQELGADVAALTASALFLAAHPVGCIYMSTSSTSPATTYGGTWTAWGAGRVPVGIDATDADFDTAEEIGGAKTHTLTTAELASHSHGATDSGSFYQSRGSGASEIDGLTSGTSFSEAGATGGVRRTSTTATAGSGSAHNNLQPYIVCYMWKRTA
jgi:hypothetical protein